jgi:alanyl aminopeptidase
MRRSFFSSVCVLAACGACSFAGQGPTAPSQAPPLVAVSAPNVPLANEPPPVGRLPSDTRPLRYGLELRVDPKQPRFSGVAEIDVQLDRVRDVIWLHGRDLAVSRATVQPAGWPAFVARWEQVSPSGVAALRLPSAVGPGKVLLHIEYEAPWGKSDQGLSVVTRGGDAYAFTQFEATDARRAFPCFDEPLHKTPFDVRLTVPKGLVALSNAPEVMQTAEPGGAFERVAFAPTPPLPTYLVAFAVGPLDWAVAPDLPPTAIRHRPLPVRFFAIKGKKRELQFAVEKTGALVTALERYFGAEYPYEKLDLVAVPEKGGAMENAGALMFEESVMLFGAPPSIEGRFNFAAYVGHELAHQWFGDLVTMPWWDDLWLNEAFATWMEPRMVAALYPELHPEVRVLESVHAAMNADSLVSARKIRQEIADDNDIDSAFDAITYDKGGAVLSMFERWIGADAFQKGIRAYLAAHRHGTASAGDLIHALSVAAGRDVEGPFRSFLDQPGLPFVEAEVLCDGGKPRVHLRQSRFLPLGSPGDGAARTWEIPVCARYGDGGTTREACTLLREREGVLPLPLETSSCPAWVMPNADGAGYYRYALAPADNKKLAAALPSLRETERISFARSVVASYMRGTTLVADALVGLAPLASDSSAHVTAPLMELCSAVGRWLLEDPLEAKLEAFADGLFVPAYKALGWAPKAGETDPPARVALRQGVLDFLAFTARDKAVRREAAAHAHAFLAASKAKADKSALTPELVGLALQVAAEDGGAPVFDALVAALDKENDDPARRRLLSAIGSATDPPLAARARELELGPSVQPNEVGRILFAGLRSHASRATREQAWSFVLANMDKLLGKTQPAYASRLVSLGAGFCDRAHRDAVEKLFAPRVAQIEGGPRALAGALEELDLCIARRAAHEPSARSFLSQKKR